MKDAFIEIAIGLLILCRELLILLFIFAVIMCVFVGGGFLTGLLRL